MQGVVYRICGNKGIAGSANNGGGIGHNITHLLDTVTGLNRLDGQNAELGNSADLAGGVEKRFRLPLPGFVGYQMQHIVGLGVEPVFHNDAGTLFYAHCGASFV